MKTIKSNIQVEPNLYYQDYDHRERFISYWQQIEYVKKVKPKTLLEVGIGNRFVYDYLKKHNYSIESFDFDERLKPDYIGDILAMDIPKKYEMVMCCEVLEHLPMEKFSLALKNLAVYSNKYLLISLPQRILPFHFYVKLPKIPAINFFFFLPRLPRINFSFDGQHYWELEVKGAEGKKIRKCFKQVGFKIEKEFTHPLDYTHRFFLLRK